MAAFARSTYMGPLMDEEALFDAISAVAAFETALERFEDLMGLSVVGQVRARGERFPAIFTLKLFAFELDREIIQIAKLT